MREDDEDLDLFPTLAVSEGDALAMVREHFAGAPHGFTLDALRESSDGVEPDDETDAEEDIERETCSKWRTCHGEAGARSKPTSCASTSSTWRVVTRAAANRKGA